MDLTTIPYVPHFVSDLINFILAFGSGWMVRRIWMEWDITLHWTVGRFTLIDFKNWRNR